MSKSKKFVLAGKNLVDLRGRTTAAPAAWANKSANSIVSLVRASIGLTVIAAFPALAQTPQFVASPNAYAYDRGVAPSVTMSGTSIVEVHRGDANAFGPLWYRSGSIQPNGIVNWSKSFQYDNGSRPSLAVSGINVIEVHEGTANGFGPLWYKTGKIQPDGSVAWSATGYQYDNGAKPSIAISGNNVIEVHQGSANGFGLLWYKTGKLHGDGSVTWSGTGYEYDYGGAPRIAASGANIIEVHQGSDNAFGPLWYKTGQFQGDGSVAWSATAYYYDSGAAPAVSLDGATILEVHEGSPNAVGPLWAHAGEFQADGTVTWNSTGFAYDTGTAPSIALAGALALEVHQEGAGFSTELYRTFRY